MTIIDAVVRLIPGVLGDEIAIDDSFQSREPAARIPSIHPTS